MGRIHAPMSSIRTRISAEAQAHERAGRLEDAIRCWEVLASSRGADGLTQVARSRREKLRRVLDNKRQARRVVMNGEGAVSAAVEDAERAGRLGLVVEIRRLQCDEDENRRTLTALASALRSAGETDEAEAVLETAFALDPSRRSNRPAHVARGALLRDLGRRAEARELLQELYDEAPNDPYAAAALAAVHLDYVEHNGETSLLPGARRLVVLALARGERPGDVNLRALYGRLERLEQRR